MSVFAVLALLITFHATSAETKTPAVRSSKIGERVAASDGSLVLTCVDRRGRRHTGPNYDADIVSPKSVTFSADGKKLYVNSLEGGTTVVYDAATRKKLKVISHKFDSGQGPEWLTPSGYYLFTHYKQGETKPFMGKPVEEAISADGRWLFVPYYRRSFDINAQDPSALAVIDTRADSIVLMAETGPLPKMVKVSNDGKLLAITHWGDNTVGFMDISNPDPHKWKHLPPVTVGQKLNLNYSLTSSVNRDSGSGYLLRGTLFLPGDSLLLVSGMAGPMAVIDVKRGEWIGMINQLQGVRHVAERNGVIYMSRNVAGEVLSVPASSVVDAIRDQRGGTRQFKVSDIRSVKVGGGARTLKPGPSGRYLYVACNSASELYVVRSADMKVIASIPVDSYPVGLDVSADGSMIVLTSQGRNGNGGNAVNFFEVEYREPEPALLPVEIVDSVASDSVASPSEIVPGVVEEGEVARKFPRILAVGIAAVAVALLSVVVLLMRHQRSKRK